MCVTQTKLKMLKVNQSKFTISGRDMHTGYSPAHQQTMPQAVLHKYPWINNWELNHFHYLVQIALLPLDLLVHFSGCAFA
jgi:hypothetical protein